MRNEALKILISFERDKSYLNISINHVLENSDLNRKDKDLLTRIVYGTAQNKLYLEYQLEKLLQGKKVKVFEKMLLLMSLYQFIYLDKIPDYAIINEAVEIAKQEKGNRTASFINAILRSFERSGIQPIIAKDEFEELAIRTSMPLFLIKMWSKQYSFEIAQKICEASLETPTLAARINTLKANYDDVLRASGGRPGYVSKDAILFEHGNIANTDFYKNGLITIQDESSQLVARVLDPKQGSYVLDMCSAPGSKSCHVAMLLENTGRIDAYDIHEHKIQLINDNASRLGVTNLVARAYDSTKLLDIYKEETFDHILLDAPCSGYGVLARKPEIKYHDSTVMDEVMILQRELLEVASKLLKNNGTMVYSTCTINKKENDFMINQFLERHKNYTKLEEKQVFPYEYHSDGFYICKLSKNIVK